jgi:hypothetical protein
MAPERADALSQVDGPNVPETLAGEPKAQLVHVKPAVARARREAVTKMLANGMSTDAIVDLMGQDQVHDSTGKERPGFSLEFAQTIALISEVRKVWDREDEERKEFAKGAAERRHYSHIDRAARKGAFTAVAMLETNLMRIQGTGEPLEVNVNSKDSRLSEALIRVLNGTNALQLRQLVDTERQRFIETTGTAVVGDEEKQLAE